MSREAHHTTGFLYEIGLLKRYSRTGLGAGWRARRRISRRALVPYCHHLNRMPPAKERSQAMGACGRGKRSRAAQPHGRDGQ
jgi:hypothetical protein